MYGKILGDLKQYRLKLNSRSHDKEETHTNCFYYVDDEAYYQMISNGFMEQPAFYTNLVASKAMISKIFLNIEARNTQHAEIIIKFEQQFEITQVEMYNTTYNFPTFIGISDQIAIASLNKYQEYDTIWMKQFTNPSLRYVGP